MGNGNEKSTEMEALYRRFEMLLTGDSLSEEEKQTLSQEILKIVYESNDEVVR